MGGSRTCVALLGLSLLVPALPASALPADPLARFATCTGRLSALLEHQWLMQDGAAARTEALRDAMDDLLAAVTLPESAVRARAIRIEAKAQAAELLSLATFGAPSRAPLAAARAAAEVAECEHLLLLDLRA